MKKLFAFSLAEMMIVLLIVAIVLAATAPMITRKISRERSDKIFDMLNVDPTNAVEYIKGRNQRIYMNARRDGYVGIRESGEEIPKNSVLFGYNKYTEDSPINFVGIGFDTKNSKNSVALGYHAKAEADSISIGYEASRWTLNDTGNGDRSVIIGNTASAGTGSVAIGYNASSKPNSVTVGYGAKALRPNTVALGYSAVASYDNSVAIGAYANADRPNTIVLGTVYDTVYIPGNLVVDQSALIGRAGRRNDNLYFRPYAQEDGRHFAVLNAGDWKGEDSNVVMVQDYNDTDWLGVKVGPFSTYGERWKKDYGDNNRAHIHFTDPTLGDKTGTYKYSDIRLKNLGEHFTGGLEELNKLEFYHFTFKNDKKKLPQVGIIAQDLQKVFPTSIKEDEEGYLKIRWDEMFYAAINAIKELNAKVIAINEKIQSITNDITNLKSIIQQQQSTIDAQAKRLTEQEKELEELSVRIEELEHRK